MFKKTLTTLAILGIVLPCYAMEANQSNSFYQRWINSGQDQCFDGGAFSVFFDKGQNNMRTSGFFTEAEITGEPNNSTGFLGGLNHRAEQHLINYYGFDLRCPEYDSAGKLTKGNPNVDCVKTGDFEGLRSLYDNINSPTRTLLFTWGPANFGWPLQPQPKYFLIEDNLNPGRGDDWQQVSFSILGLPSLPAGVVGTIPATYTFPDNPMKTIQVINAGQKYYDGDLFGDGVAIEIQTANPLAGYEKLYSVNLTALYRHVQDGNGFFSYPQFNVAWDNNWICSGNPKVQFNTGIYSEDYHIRPEPSCPNKGWVYNHGDWRFKTYVSYPPLTPPACAA